MKITLLEIDKKAVFPQFLKNTSNGINVSLALVLGVDKNVIDINNNNDIEFLDQDLVNIALEAGWCIGQPKRHCLLLEMAISSLESRLPFITLFYPYPMVSTRKIELDEPFYLT